MKGKYNIINMEEQVKFLEWNLQLHKKYLSYHFVFCNLSQITFNQFLKSLYPTKQLNQSSSQERNFKQLKRLGTLQNFNMTGLKSVPFYF